MIGVRVIHGTDDFFAMAWRGATANVTEPVPSSIWVGYQNGVKVV